MSKLRVTGGGDCSSGSFLICSLIVPPHINFRKQLMRNSKVAPVRVNIARGQINVGAGRFHLSIKLQSRLLPVNLSPPPSIT